MRRHYTTQPEDEAGQRITILGDISSHIAQYHAYASTGALVIEGATSPNTLILVLAGILIELMKICEAGISLDDHHRSLQSLISQHFVSGDSSYVRMSHLAL